jgi:hypothetical protein
VAGTDVKFSVLTFTAGETATADWPGLVQNRTFPADAAAAEGAAAAAQGWRDPAQHHCQAMTSIKSADASVLVIEWTPGFDADQDYLAWWEGQAQEHGLNRGPAVISEPALVVVYDVVQPADNPPNLPMYNGSPCGLRSR